MQPETDMPEIDEAADLEHIRRTEALVRTYKAKELHEIGEELCNLSKVSSDLGVAIRMGERCIEDGNDREAREVLGDLLLLLVGVRSQVQACATWHRIHEHAATVAVFEAMKKARTHEEVTEVELGSDSSTVPRSRKREARRAA